MPITKEYMCHLLRIVWLFAIAFLTVLNGRGDAPSPEQLSAAKKLGEQYQMALKSSQGASQLQAALRKAIANIDAASAPAATNGNNLPASFTDLYFRKKQTGDVPQVKPGFMGLKADNFLDQYTLLWAGQLANTAPELLTPILQERASVFPPTAADYILYGQINAALDNNNYDLTPNGSPTDPNQVSLSRSAGLLQLAHAKNPVYRLLAARAC